MASRVNPRRSSRSSVLVENDENRLNTATNKIGVKNVTNNRQNGVKRKADSLLENNIPTKKRNVLGDVTNAVGKKIAHGRNQVQKLGLKKSSNNVSNINQNLKVDKSVATNKSRNLSSTKGHLASVTALPRSSNNTATAPLARQESLEDQSQFETALSHISSLSRESVGASRIAALRLSTSHNDDPSTSNAAPEKNSLKRKSLTVLEEEFEPEFPEGVDDYDKECMSDTYAVANYAPCIFSYYKLREAKFIVGDYLERQLEINESMRAILVDWMVEVQESFELNHETLYLAVKLADLYLCKASIGRDDLQLVGATALFIACKFDERTPPYIDDFLYICDDAYTRSQIINFEMTMLKEVGFDLGAPLSYRYLRRYARCAKVSMEELTLARYMLESSLMDYDLVRESDSCLAAAALMLARHVIGTEPCCWNTTMQHYSGFTQENILPVAQALHKFMACPPRPNLTTVKNKYSHKVFYEVAKMPVPETLEL